MRHLKFEYCFEDLHGKKQRHFRINKLISGNKWNSAIKPITTPNPNVFSQNLQGNKIFRKNNRPIQKLFLSSFDEIDF